MLRGALPRLGEFLEPFICCPTAPQRANAKEYVEGLLSDLESKDPLSRLNRPTLRFLDWDLNELAGG